jgi:hypothetical protein
MVGFSVRVVDKAKAVVTVGVDVVGGVVVFSVRSVELKQGGFENGEDVADDERLELGPWR